ncbi:MAG: hypothetical protein MK161_08390 [Pirellulales bacterium]|nr:hypothetical protein [Pirellulales bacterium]
MLKKVAIAGVTPVRMIASGKMGSARDNPAEPPKIWPSIYVSPGLAELYREPQN